jgi:hypothetical protein
MNHFPLGMKEVVPYGSILAVKESPFSNHNLLDHSFIGDRDRRSIAVVTKIETASCLAVSMSLKASPIKLFGHFN